MSNLEQTSTENTVPWRKRIYWPKEIFDQLVREAATENRPLPLHIVHIVERHFAATNRKVE